MSAPVLAAAVLALAAAGAVAQRSPAPDALRTIERLYVPRYLGTWYEIARFPNRFQRQCAGDVRAEYAQRSDGTLRVLNRCRRNDGREDEAEGQARQPEGPDSPRLQVRFAPAWLSWLPLVWGDYWVVDLDPGYRLSAVSEPRREYLWVLSRTPTVDEAEYAALLQRLAAQGLDVERLQRTPQRQP